MLAYQVIAPLVMGEAIDASFIILRVVLVLVCLVLQAILYGWGLNISHRQLMIPCSACGLRCKSDLKSCRWV